MVRSVKNRNKRSKAKSALKKRKKSLARLGARQAKEMVEIKLPFVSLGDLRERWRQKETPLDPCLSEKISRFKRIKIPRDKPLCIRGSDGGLLMYGVALNEPEMVNGMYSV